jgi:hypothetical protein
MRGVADLHDLQVRTDAGFGTVCGANMAAADATRPENRPLCFPRWNQK